MENAVVSDLAVGSVFVGRYRVERRIAAGGMGAVYEIGRLSDGTQLEFTLANTGWEKSFLQELLQRREHDERMK